MVATFRRRPADRCGPASRREPDPPAFWIVVGALAWVTAMCAMAAQANP